MDKRIFDVDYSEDHRREQRRWYTNDIKHHRKSKFHIPDHCISILTPVKLWFTAYYVNEIIKKNDRVQTVAQLDRLELLNNYTDRWPLISLRKKILRLRIHINVFASIIIKRKEFEAATITVIMINCVTLSTSKANQ